MHESSSSSSSEKRERRWRKVVKLRSGGMTQKKVAKKLKISLKTVCRDEQAGMRKVAERLSMSFPAAWKQYKQLITFEKMGKSIRIDESTMAIRLKGMK